MSGWEVTRVNADLYYGTNKSAILMYNAPTSERILQMTEPNIDNNKSKPFLQRIQLKGKTGTIVRATGQIDDGAMKNCISLERWERYGHCLDTLKKSQTIISVANSTEIESKGTWTGIVQVGETGALSHFEVFDCKGAFDVILGKPWLRAVRAQHDYTTDKITIGKEGEQEVITNILETDRSEETTVQTNPATPLPPTPTNTDNDKPPSLPSEDKEPDYRERTHTPPGTTPTSNIDGNHGIIETTPDEQLSREWIRVEQINKTDTPREEERWTDWIRGNDSNGAALDNQKNEGEILKNEQIRKFLRSEVRITQLKNRIDNLGAMADNYTRENFDVERSSVTAIGDVTKDEFKINRGTNTSARITNTFDEERVQKILTAIEIGPDLTEEQKEQVCALVREYADIFALSLSEVLYVDWYKHKLHIEPNQTFPTRINQRPITEGQKEWFNNILDDMEKSFIIQKVPGDFIKNLSSTNLAPKEAGKTGITRTEILRQVNQECKKNGLPPFWEQISDEEELKGDAILEAVENAKPETPKTKWRVCHAFNALNKATQVPPFPAGDLRTKQEFAAGHRWASVIDFAAGYYAVPLDDETVPYVAFYVEGRGYYVYLRMPFGLTGAPATFCKMVAIALDDMIGRELVNWMDDICLPGDIFETKLSNLRRFFDRCRVKNLSLSPTKTKLFFTEVLFAGAMVGSQGIRPNLDKVGAVVKWPIPETVQQLMGFLGLTNYFRRLIVNYARIAAPLSDLTRDVMSDQPNSSWRARKGAYKRALVSTSLKDKWGPDQQKAFVTLKCLLSEEPLLRTPQFDGRPFRVTTDGSMQGFAGFLSQPFTSVDSNGKEVTRWHPISYCSKRTSKSEAKYEPFLLEFAALKYSLDEFEPYIYGSPLEIETDCQALRDCLLQEKMSVHHSRWKESILAHNIIAIRHRPGIENPVADGLSRMWDGHKKTDVDGSDWSVLPNWEATKGIVNDILSISYVPPTLHPLEAQFAGDIFFEPIVKHLLGHDAGSTPSERRKATHRATDFTIVDDKLWKISSKASDRVTKTECIPTAQGFDYALDAHMKNGCFGSEHVQLHLKDQYFWPGMLTDCKQALLECPKCKSFGAATRNSALQPIRRTQPFALVAGDYLSLPVGKGGFKTVGLYIDTYSGFVWGTKLKTTGTGKTTIASLKRIFHDYAVPKSFMSDGGSHFNNNEVDQFCSGERVQHIVTPAYAPWVNGLIENANRLLLGRLKRLCAPNHDNIENATTVAGSNLSPVPESWPEYLDEAIRQLNDRILPALKATPRELLFGLPLRPDSAVPLVPLPTSPVDTHINFTLAETFRANAHLLSLEDAERRKMSFDTNSPIVKFHTGDLVQIYDSVSDFNYRSINKLAPKWSEPRIIYGELSNSFLLCTLTGIPLKGPFHSRRLRHYIPLRGTSLDILYPREDITPPIDDLEIVEAEEKMATEFDLNQSLEAL
jgi:transposase InsO family protein